MMAAMILLCGILTGIEPMLVRFSEEKYSMDCQLLFADGGNGIQPEDVQTKLTMDYFKEKKLLQIHP